MAGSTPLGLCGLCGGDDLHGGDDGFFYCTACGSQSQLFQEEALDLLDTQFVGAIKRSNPRQQPTSLPSHGPLPPPSHPFYQPLRAGASSLSAAGAEDALDEETLSHALAGHIRQRYLEGLQKMLHLQCEAAVLKFGLSPLICGYVGPIWLRFVAFTHVCEKEWAMEAIEVEEARKDRRLAKRGDDSMHTGELFLAKKTGRKKQSSWEPRTRHGTKASLVWLAALKERIPLAITLAILFLACHIVQEPVLPPDIVKWCLEGTLPYLTAFHKVAESGSNDTNPLPMDATLMFKPTHPVSAKKLEFMAASVASRVGLQLPPVNFHAISCRFLRQLQLSVENHSVYVSRFFDWYVPKGLWISDKVGDLPSRVYVMAMVVIVLKVLYRIHGQGYWERTLKSRREPDKTSILYSDKKYDNYSQGARATEQAKFSFPKDNDLEVVSLNRLPQDGFWGLMHKNGEKEEVYEQKESQNVANHVWDGQILLEHLERFRLEANSHHFDYEHDLPTYLNYCRDTVFFGAKLETEEHNLCNHLWMLYEKSREEESLMKITKKLHCNDGEGGAMHMPSAYVDDHDSDLNCIPSKDGCANTCKHLTDCTSLYYSLGRRKECVSGTNFLGGLAQDIQSKLLQIIYDIEESGFLYVPPRRKSVPPDGYIRYIRQDARGGVNPEFVHADYFILLRACAVVVDVHPKALHRCIQRLERGLKQSEKISEPNLQLSQKNKDGVD